jgi:hypothetical protein
MTGDELAARLFAEQGYLVLASLVPYKEGQALPHLQGVNGVSSVVKIICSTSESDYLRQLNRVRELAPVGPWHDADGLASYYYRVEAAD